MRKRLIAAALLSAAVLSGCGRTVSKPPEFSFSSAAPQSSCDSTNDSTSEISDIPLESSSSSDSGNGESSSSEIPERQEGEYAVVLDPLSERTVICSGSKIVLTGKTSGGFRPTLSIPHTEEYSESGGNFTYTAVIQSGYTGYGNLLIFKSCYVRLYAYKGEVSFVVDDEAFEANRKAIENAIDQPLSQVAEYIATNADGEKIAEVLGEITQISNRICEGLTSDYDKLRAISLWVSENIYYDYPAFDEGVPADTLTLDYMLKNKSSVCGGYSNMTSALAAVQGIKVYNVHGSAVNNNMTFGERDPAYHEWNYAIIDGRVILIDSGWNSHCVLNRNGSYSNGGVTVKYFDISPEALAQNHKARYAEYRDYFALLEE